MATVYPFTLGGTASANDLGTLIFSNGVTLNNDGTLTVPMLAQQVAAEGVTRIALVSEEIERYAARSGLPTLVSVHDRRDLDAVQRELREYPGVSVIIYDQTCAAEKRRRRKKGEYPQSPLRAFINEAVCEGCGDCGVQSNCTSLMPLETPLGRKRVVDQSSCNQDLSCIKGFCPSFVTVVGGSLRKSRLGADVALPELPDPVLPTLGAQPYNILITGIGGTGVITVGALLGMAAHLERKGTSALDMTGMSQKNGAVTSHVRIARAPADIHAQRIATGEADLILGCDMLTAGAFDAIAKTRPGRTTAVINLHEPPPGPFAKAPDWQFPSANIRSLLDEATAQRAHFVDATRLATALMGDSIAANLFMLGYAFQRGLIPLEQASLYRAIELNAVAVEANKRAFAWGRHAAVDLALVERTAAGKRSASQASAPLSLDALIADRVARLSDYQHAAYAKRYVDFVAEVRAAEEARVGGTALSTLVARYLYKLMAYKDEYEVARLHTDGRLEASLRETFEGEFEVQYNLAPPLFAKRDGQGHLQKARFGAWLRPLLKTLARLKGLRGTPLDVFGYSAERRQERQLIEDYRQAITALLPRLNADNLPQALTLAALPEDIRGFGHVKQAHLAKVLPRWQALVAELPRNA